MLLLPLYPIIDFSCFAAQSDSIAAIVRYAEELISAGATLIQLRDKHGATRQMIEEARTIKAARRCRRVPP